MAARAPCFPAADRRGSGTVNPVRRPLLAAVLVLAVGAGGAAVALGGRDGASAPAPAVSEAPLPPNPPPTSEPAGLQPSSAPTDPTSIELLADPPPAGGAAAGSQGGADSPGGTASSDRAALTARIGALVERPDLDVDAPLGIAVLDQEGREVYARAAQLPLLPASTQKAVTAAAALLTFGSDHRFETRVALRPRGGGVRAPIGARGRFDGDLVLAGSGDPALASRGFQRFIYPIRPRTSLERLADRVVDAGITEVTGGVIGDGSVFGADTAPRGWKQEYFRDFDARHITGLTIDAGLRYQVDSPPPDLELRLTVSPDPIGQAAAMLHQALQERGVRFGTTTDSRHRPVRVARTVATVSSPPLGELLRHALERSDNHMADTLFRAVGSAHHHRGSWLAGGLAARAVFDRLGVPRDGAVFADGSGLSRADRLTAQQLARLDVAMASSRHAAAWADAMAVAGREGTLRRRLLGTLAEGRFRGKSGTLDDVKSLVGAVAGPAGRRYHLAVIGNGVDGSDRLRLRVLMDELVLALAADLHGCRFVTPSPSPSPPSAAGSGSPPSASPAPLTSRAQCPEAA